MSIIALIFHSYYLPPPLLLHDLRKLACSIFSRILVNIEKYFYILNCDFYFQYNKKGREAPYVTMTSFATVDIPAYEFQFNLVVYPLPDHIRSLVISHFLLNVIIFCFLQGHSYFFVLKDNAVHAHPTGGSHWLRFLPVSRSSFYKE